MEYQVGPACYSTAVQAAQASASAQAGAIVQHGGAAYMIEVASVQSDAIDYALHPVAGGAAVTLSVPYNAQPCGLLALDDGLAFGWGIAAVWLGVYALTFIGRVVADKWGADDGNT